MDVVLTFGREIVSWYKQAAVSEMVNQEIPFFLPLVILASWTKENNVSEYKVALKWYMHAPTYAILASIQCSAFFK